MFEPAGRVARARRWGRSPRAPARRPAGATSPRSSEMAVRPVPSASSSAKTTSSTARSIASDTSPPAPGPAVAVRSRAPLQRALRAPAGPPEQTRASRSPRRRQRLRPSREDTAGRLRVRGVGSRYDDELWALVPMRTRRRRQHGERGVRARARRRGRTRWTLAAGTAGSAPELQAERLTVADVSPVALARARLRVPRGSGGGAGARCAPAVRRQRLRPGALRRHTRARARRAAPSVRGATRAASGGAAGGHDPGARAPHRPGGADARLRAQIPAALATPALLHAGARCEACWGSWASRWCR